MADGPRLLGVIHLKDIVKGGMRERIGAVGGHLTLQMKNEVATKNVDRAGRRIFSGLVAASLFVSGAYLLKGDHETRGWVFVAMGSVVCAMHWLRDVLAKPRA